MDCKEIKIPRWILTAVSDKDRYVRDMFKHDLGIVPLHWECVDQSYCAHLIFRADRWIRAR